VILHAAWLALGAVGCSTVQGQKPPAAEIADASTAEDPVLVRLRGLLEEARGAQKAEDFDGARARITEAIEDALTETAGREDGPACALLEEMGWFAHVAGEFRAAERARRRVLDVRSRTLAGDHPDLQKARGNLALTLAPLGDLPGARALLEQVLEVQSRTLPDDHPHLQLARQGLAAMMYAQGDLEGARALIEKVLEISERTLPDDNLDLQLTRHGLGVAKLSLGDLEGARILFEKVLETPTRTLPDDHLVRQGSRQGLAATIGMLGDLAGSRLLLEKVIEIDSRKLPDDHPDLQKARSNLAVTIASLGDQAGARALLEKVLEVCSRTLPEDHPDLQAARQNLAESLSSLGELAEARALGEMVLEVLSRTLADDHPDLQVARGSLASTLRVLGDLEGARELEEQVLEVYSRTLPDDHPHLQQARQSLAATRYSLGDLAGAQALFEVVFEVLSRTLPDDHPFLQDARQNLAVAVGGRFARPAGLPAGETEREQERKEGRESCTELLLAICRAQTRAARAVLLESSAREAQGRCEELAVKLHFSLSFAAGVGVFEPIPVLDRASFELSETTRGAALGAASLMRQGSAAPEYLQMREELRALSEELAGQVQKGSSSAEFQATMERRDGLQRELATLAREVTGGNPTGLDFDAGVLATRLLENEVLVGFRRYLKWEYVTVTDQDLAGPPPRLEQSVASLCALVLRRGPDGSPSDESAGILTRVDLGPVATIEEAVRTWREGLGAGADSRGLSVDSAASPRQTREEELARGRRLRRMIFDPLLPALLGADHVVVALDDVLHLVPLEALPADEGGEDRGEPLLVGERWRIETRVTLAELLAPVRKMEANGELLAVGGVAYGTMQDASIRRNEEAGVLRGGAWSTGFSDLPATAVEVESIAEEFREQHPMSGLTLLEDRDATRERLLELAPRSRWLHVATHGWFASESIRSWKDPEPIDRLSGLGHRFSGEEQVKGMSPMLLCGLALAGCNLPVNQAGRVPGLVTAEELSALDLSNCELAVLSACDTNVGERRAGQGVASLQMALQMAGARSVITSLWKVPDEATRELMTDFYRRVWVEKKPKWRALWEAKLTLRDARDERGGPKYAVRDWAAWVLTGEPD